MVGIDAWYCVRTEVHSEPRAKMALDARGYTTFLPLEKARSHHKGKGDVYRPVFGRYLFVGKSDYWYEIKRCWGVQGLVTKLNPEGERVPAVISDTAIQEFKKAINSGLFDKTKRYGLREGDLARIIRGPFADQIIRVIKFRGQDRVLVMMAMLGADRPTVDIAARDLEAVLTG